MPQAHKKARVFIVDDDPQYQKLLAYKIGRTRDFEVCGQTQDPKASQRLVYALNPDIVLMDLMGFEATQGGIDLIRSIRKTHPNLPILAISMFDPDLYSPIALAAGATSYLWKDEMDERLEVAIEKTLKSESYVSQEGAQS